MTHSTIPASRQLCLLVVSTLLTGCATGIDGLAIDDNPASTISPIVQWTTAQEGSSTVEFRGDDGVWMRIGDATPTTDHRVAIAGMQANRSYTVRSVTELEDGEVWTSEEMDWDTGGLPFEWMVNTVDVNDPTAHQGWTLANVATGIFGPAVVVMLDMSGEPVWYAQCGEEDGRADIEATWVDGERVLIGPGMAGGDPIVEVDLSGEVHWEGPEQPPLDTGSFLDLVGDGVMHHTLTKLDDGSYLTTQFDYRDEVIGDEIRRFDADHNVLWSWNAFDHIELDEETLGMLGEWTHVNSLIADDDQGVVYANSWNLDRFWQIDQATGEVLLTIGAGGDLAPDPTAEFPWFEGAHSLERLDDGSWLLYDNGAHGRGWSRLVQYELDFEARSSKVVWEYPGELTDDHWYNYSWGDVDVLPNGNLLMQAGNGVQGYDPTRLVEVTRDGEILWQMWWHDSEAMTTGSFAFHRIEALAVAVE